MSLTITLPALHPAQQQVAACDARFIVLVTGRRWGKTRYGAVRCIVTALRGGRAWWIAPSFPMTRVGWRLLKQLAIQVPGAEVREADRIIHFPGGGTVQVRSGDAPDSLRGEGLDLVVLDECAYMKREVWADAIRPALSDRQGGALFISSPKGGNWFGELYQYARARQAAGDPQWAAFRFPTADNPFIEADEIARARHDLSDRLFRQEYEAEILLDTPGALWTRALLDAGRVDICPPLARAVVAIDPAVTATEDSDETGIVLAGIAADGQGYVFSDLSGRYSPDTWARKAITAYRDGRLDRVIAEVNNGGDLVEATLRTVDRTVSYRAVRATRGKWTRAEPIAALYEQGRVHHVGHLPALEDQLCAWKPGDPSPDRLDALVWALSDLMLGTARGGVTLR